MNKEEARKELKKAESELRQAEIVMEMHENDIREVKEEMSKLEATINNKDDWRDELVQPDTTGFYFIERDEDKGFVVEEGYFSPRKPEHAFKRWRQAELIMDKMLLMQEMHAFAHVRNDGWVADWSDKYVTKFGIVHSIHKGFTGSYRWGCNDFVFGITVKSIEIAKEMLEEFGDRIKKIYNKQY